MLFFSRAHPNLASVNPAMDRISAQHSSDASNDQQSLPIRAGIKKGMELLNKYYKFVIDESEIHQISTSTRFHHLWHFKCS